MISSFGHQLQKCHVTILNQSWKLSFNFCCLFVWAGDHFHIIGLIDIHLCPFWKQWDIMGLENFLPFLMAHFQIQYKFMFYTFTFTLIVLPFYVQVKKSKDLVRVISRFVAVKKKRFVCFPSIHRWANTVRESTRNWIQGKTMGLLKDLTQYDCAWS